MWMTPMLLAVGLAAEPLTLHVQSPARRVPLVELFTSEGCSSCPPADALLPRLGEGDAAVPLAYHVTYWDYIGWRDRFASALFDQRQRSYARRKSTASVYTPQILVDGEEQQGGRAGLDRLLERRRGEPAAVAIDLTVTWDAASRALAAVAVATRSAGKEQPGEALVVQIAVFERRLETPIGAGENRGRTLKHDFVVRSLPAPASWPAGAARAEARTSLLIPADWKPADLGVAGFVQGERSGEVLQATAVTLTH